MNERIEFESPENVKISYQVAGQGTRFLAWLADNIFLTIFCILLLIGFVIIGVSFDGVFEEWIKSAVSPDEVFDGQQFSMVFMGIWLMVWSLGSFFYFGFSELVMRGQTIGKRMSKIRVVKADGFSLDPISILIRTLFRVVDQLPPLWIVPVLTKSSQRFGDLVAGTLVVTDEAAQISTIREVLSSRQASESKFRITGAMLKRAQPADFSAIESILERWPELPDAHSNALTMKIVPVLAEKMQTEAPELPDHRQFLEDLLAAEFRRQSRSMG